MKHIEYNWTQLMQDCEMIAEALRYRDDKYKIKWIYGPPRGGCIFAVILSHKLNAKYLTTLKEKHNPLNTLIVDDVSDTGATLKDLVRRKPYVTATAFIKPQTIYIPNIYCRTVSNKTWIDYPWEKY
jgi:hypoxanthine phosphoribosyltransferase